MTTAAEALSALADAGTDPYAPVSRAGNIFDAIDRASHGSAITLDHEVKPSAADITSAVRAILAAIGGDADDRDAVDDLACETFDRHPEITPDVLRAAAASLWSAPAVAGRPAPRRRWM